MPEHDPKLLFSLLKKTFPNRCDWDLVEPLFVPEVLMPMGAKIPDGTPFEAYVEMTRALLLIPDLQAIYARRLEEAR